MRGPTGMSIIEAFFFIDCRFFTRWPMSLMLWFSQERVRVPNLACEL